MGGTSFLLAAVGAMWLLIFLHATSMPFNYDEIAESHATWQVSQGARPYQDFHYDHTPFFWRAYAPILKRLPENFESLVTLRTVNLFFSAAAFFFLGLLILRFWGDQGKVFAGIGAMVVMALQFPVLQTFSEFRADAISFAFQLGGMAALESADGSRRRKILWAAAGFLLVWAAMFSLKIFSLTLIFLILFVWDGFKRDRRGLVLSGVCFASGACVALALAGWVCAAMGIDYHLMYESVVRFHRLFLSSYGASFGLAKSLWELGVDNPALFVLVALGLYGVVLFFMSEKWRRQKSLAALALFCLLQPLWVHYPWRQYAAGLLFVWSAPLAMAFHSLLRGRFGRAWLFVGGALLLLGARGEFLRVRESYRNHFVDKHIQAGNQLLQWVPKDGFVAAQPPFHPVFRRNSTYFFTYPLNPGRDTEELLSLLSRTGDRFTLETYRRQLRSRPPELIVLDPRFAGKNYVAAVQEFLRDRSAQYSLRHVGPIAVHVRDGETLP